MPGRKREPNAIDFWRGFALVSIFINHIPGIWFEKLTHRNFGFSDSAELFVLLAGWSLRIIVGFDERKESNLQLAVRLGGRAVTLYAAQIVITMLALAMIAAASLWFDNPLLLDWNNAGAVFREPAPTVIGLVLLTHQLGYFDILPLYVVLISLAPGVALLDRFAPRLLLPLSFCIYAAAILFQINAPTWPLPGEWFFNPFAWQFIYVLGFWLARETRPGHPFAATLPRLRWPALAFVAVALIAAWRGAWPDPTLFPWLPSPYLFIVDKSYLTPLRLAHALSLCAAFVAVYSGILRYGRPVARFGSMLGRNSLYVFCVGSLLSLAGQLIRAAAPPSLWLDSAVVLVGIGVLWGTAWLSEARSRLAQQRA